MKLPTYSERFAVLRQHLDRWRPGQLRLWVMRGLMVGFLLAGSQLLAAYYLPHAMPLAQTTIRIAGHPIQVEVARTPAARTYGLMNRAALPPGHGMLFVFQAAHPVVFWMKHTLIPLDILYFGNDGTLKTLLANRPPCHVVVCPEYPSAGSVRYVVEINAGEAARMGLKTGDRLLFQGVGR